MGSHAGEGDGEAGLPAMAEEVVEVGREGERFVSPVGKAEESPDPDATEAAEVGALGAIEPPVEVLFGARGVEGFVGVEVVGFLVNDEAFGSVIDEVAVLIVFHRPDFDPDGGDEGLEGVDAFLKVAVGDELRVFAGHEEDIAEPEVVEVLCFGHDLGDGQGGAQDGIIARKAAVLAVVDAFVGEIEGSEEAHRASEVTSGQGLALAGHRLELFVGAGLDELLEASDEGGGGFEEGIELGREGHLRFEIRDLRSEI